MIVPNDLVVISNNLFPSNLSDAELAAIIYAKWYKVAEIRMGECIAVSQSDIPSISNSNVRPIEEVGYSFKDISVEVALDFDKKWNEIKGFFV